MTFDDAESVDCVSMITRALWEDLTPQALLKASRRQPLEPWGDRTSEAIVSDEQRGRAIIVARSEGILAGLPAVTLVMERIGSVLPVDGVNPEAGKIGFQHGLENPFLQPLLEDGSQLRPGDRIARLEGPMRCILAAERTALNFLQHLSGIATLTWRFVEATKGLPCRILDTRKTLPGWRLLEKYAVRCGGGFNHRMGLYDGVLIKDNHLGALGGGPDAICRAIKTAREKNGPDIPVEVEVENLEMLEVALVCQPDIILLDNMSLNQMREAVKRRNEKSHKVELEASGRITLDDIRAVAETGVDRISVGALTHSAPALDIALDYETT
jgi:nicotinate-nucleotide pyrophosphorylase (carboxylating)